MEPWCVSEPVVTLFLLVFAKVLEDRTVLYARILLREKPENNSVPKISRALLCKEKHLLPIGTFLMLTF